MALNNLNFIGVTSGDGYKSAITAFATNYLNVKNCKINSPEATNGVNCVAANLSINGLEINSVFKSYTVNAVEGSTCAIFNMVYNVDSPSPNRIFGENEISSLDMPFVKNCGTYTTLSKTFRLASGEYDITDFNMNGCYNVTGATITNAPSTVAGESISFVIAYNSNASYATYYVITTNGNVYMGVKRGGTIEWISLSLYTCIPSGSTFNFTSRHLSGKYYAQYNTVTFVNGPTLSNEVILMIDYTFINTTMMYAICITNRGNVYLGIMLPNSKINWRTITLA